MYNESVILAALCRRAAWQKFRGVLKAGHFSHTESRKLYSRLDSIHAASEADIPEAVFDLGLPSPPLDLDAILEDFAARCVLSDTAIKAEGLLNKPDSLKLEAIRELYKPIEGPAAQIESEDYDSRIVKEGKDTEVQRYLTGVPIFDGKLQGGLAPKELVYVAAAPHRGKTHWLSVFGAGFASQGIPVIHLILEDLPGSVVGYYAKATRSLLPAARDRFDKSIQLMKFGDTVFTTRMFDEIARKYFSGRPEGAPAVMLVDYMDIVNGHGSEEERIRVTKTAVELKRLTYKHNLITIAGTQGDTSSWESLYPTMGSFADAKIGKAKPADVVFFWSQLSGERQSGDGRMGIVKARDRDIPYQYIPLNVNWDTYEIRYKG